MKSSTPQGRRCKFTVTLGFRRGKLKKKWVTELCAQGVQRSTLATQQSPSSPMKNNRLNLVHDIRSRKTRILSFSRSRRRRFHDALKRGGHAWRLKGLPNDRHNPGRPRKVQQSSRVLQPRIASGGKLRLFLPLHGWGIAGMVEFSLTVGLEKELGGRVH
jgi:hypothetical protein